MARITRILAGPDDEMYREGLRSYNPHWTRHLRAPRAATPDRRAAERAEIIQ
jgi:hypothetical protein